MRLILILFSFFVFLLNSSCTLIGFYSGAKHDIKSYSSDSVDFDSLKFLEVGNKIKIILKNGIVCKGTFLSISYDVSGNAANNLQDVTLENENSTNLDSRFLLQIWNDQRKYTFYENDILKVETYEPTYMPILGAMLGFGFDYIVFGYIKKSFDWKKGPGG